MAVRADSWTSRAIIIEQSIEHGAEDLAQLVPALTTALYLREHHSLYLVRGQIVDIRATKQDLPKIFVRLHIQNIKKSPSTFCVVAEPTFQILESALEALHCAAAVCIELLTKHFMPSLAQLSERVPVDLRSKLSAATAFVRLIMPHTFDSLQDTAVARTSFANASSYSLL